MGGWVLSAAAAPVEISFIWWGGNPNNLWDVAKSKFEALHPDIQVNLVNGMRDKQLVSSIAGTADAMIVDGSWYPEFMQKGLLMPLDSLLAAEPAAQTALDDFWPGAYNWARTDGKLYGFPFEWFQTLVLFYNQNQFSAAGLQPLKSMHLGSWNDLAPLAQKLSDDNGHFGIDSLANAWLINRQSQINGGGYTDSQSHPTKATLTNPRTIHTAEFWIDLVRNHFSGGSFNGGTAAMHWGWWGEEGVWGKLPFDFDFAVPPLGPEAAGDAKLPTSATVFSIATGSKHPKEALEWILFITSPEIMKLATVDGAGIPTRRSVALSPEWLSALGHDNHAALAPLAGPTVPNVPMTPVWTRMNQLLDPVVKAAMNGKQPIAEGFAAANSQVQALLDEAKVPGN